MTLRFCDLPKILQRERAFKEGDSLIYFGQLLIIPPPERFTQWKRSSGGHSAGSG